MQDHPTALGSAATIDWNRWSFWFVVLIYALINVAIWMTTDSELRLRHAGDGVSWYLPAVGLYEHGAFVYPDAPGEANAYRPPMFPMFGAAMFWLYGEVTPNAIALGQIVLLLITGLLLRNAINDWFPGWGTVGMALLLLNPNVLTIVQFTQSDPLFLFFMTVALWAVLRVAKGQNSWRYPLIAGTAVALACLTRPTAQFLIVILPIVFPMLAALNRNFAGAWRSFAQGCAALALAVVVISPWIVHVQAVDGHYGLSDSKSRYRYLWDQITMVESQSNNLSYFQASRRLEVDPEGPRARLIEQYGPGWSDLTDNQRFAHLTDEGFGILLSYPAGDLAKAYARSVAQFLCGGGSGRLHYVLKSDPERLAELWFATSQSSLFDIVRTFFSTASPVALGASAFALGFVLLARIVGTVGLISMVRRRAWPLLAVLIPIISYFALIHLFVGNSRYRLVTEPALMFLVVIGLEAIWRHVRGRYR